MMDDTAPHLAWEPAAAASELAPGEVHLWCWSLLVEGADELIDRLSVLELARAKRFVQRHHARRYVVAHARMRDLLEGYTGRKHVALGTGAQGKPCMLGPHPLEFNLSHADNVAVLAVARGIPVGVDVEQLRLGAEHPLDQLAPAEQAYLGALRGEQQATGFYRCWTRKEALLKGLGIGLPGGLRAFSVPPGTDRATLAPDADPDVQEMAAWRVRDLDPARGFVGCLATPGEVATVRCFRLEQRG